MTVSGAQASLQQKSGAPGAGAYGPWNATDNDCLAWSVDPGLVAGSGLGWAAGVAYLMRAKMQSTSPISKIGFALRSTAAADLTNTYAGIYTISGTTATLIGSTPDISSSMNGVATQTFFNLSTPTASLDAGTKIFIGFLYGSATTAPSVQGTSSAIANAFISSKGNYRSLSGGSGLTALPSSIDLTTYSNPAQVFCVVAA